jgi:hypothetical protein
MPGDIRRRVRMLAATALLITVTMLTACGEGSKSLVQTIRAGVLGGPAVAVSPDDVARRPLFQLLVSNEHGKALLILGNVDGHREAWYGPRGSAVFLEEGRVVKTANLEENLEGTRVIGTNPFVSGLHRLAAPVEFDSVDDWSPGYRYGVVVHNRLVPADVESVEILGQSRQLLRVDEERRSGDASWNVTAHYWVDPETGFIWKSHQQLGPGLGMELVQLKPRLQGGPR